MHDHVHVHCLELDPTTSGLGSSEILNIDQEDLTVEGTNSRRSTITFLVKAPSANHLNGDANKMGNRSSALNNGHLCGNDLCANGDIKAAEDPLKSIIKPSASQSSDLRAESPVSAAKSEDITHEYVDEDDALNGTRSTSLDHRYVSKDKFFFLSFFFFFSESAFLLSFLFCGLDTRLIR